MATDHYEVRDIRGGYYNSFKNYTDAKDLQDLLWYRHHVRTIIMDVKEWEVK